MADAGFPLDAFESLVARDRSARLTALRREVLPGWQIETLFGDSGSLDVLEPDDQVRLTEAGIQKTQLAKSNVADLEWTALKQLRELSAVIMVQSVWRRFAIQKRYRWYQSQHARMTAELATLAPPINAARGQSALIERRRPPSAAPLPPLPESVYVRARMTFQHVRYCEIVARLPKHPFPLVDFQGYCAVRIQAFWRRHFTQMILKDVREEMKEASKEEQMQHFWQMLKQRRGIKIDVNIAVQRIQRAWRSHYNRKVFKFMKQLLTLKQNAHPRRLLQYINPQEARLMDGSMPIHIRLRFGGRHFPPTIYYKVYLTAGVVDLNAFAPRAYTVYSPKTTLPTKSASLPVASLQREFRAAAEEESGWYQRFENNGWRAVYNGTWTTMEADYNDEVTATTKQTAAPSSTTEQLMQHPLQRKEDVQRKRKEKKLLWMRKLYALTQPVVDSEINEETTKEICSEEATVQTEAKLESWAATLDFDVYQLDWLQLATCIEQEEQMEHEHVVADLPEFALTQEIANAPEEDQPSLFFGVAQPVRLSQLLSNMSLSDIRESRMRSGLSTASSPIWPKSRHYILEADETHRRDGDEVAYDLFNLTTDQDMTFNFNAFELAS